MVNSEKKKNGVYLKNALVLMFDSVIKIVVGFVLTVLIARFFGPGKFGDVNYVYAVIEILQIFVMFGFDDIVLRDLGQKKTEDETVLSNAILLRLCFAFIFYIVGLLLFIFILGKNFLPLYFILGVQLFFYAFYIFKQWFQIHSLNKYMAIASQVSFGVLSIAKIIIIFFNIGDLRIYAGALAFSMFAEVLFFFLFYAGCVKNISLGKIDFTYQKKLLRDSLPIVFQNFAIIIYMKIDQLMIGKTLSSSELGIYSIAVTISQVIYFFFGSLLGAFYPKIAEKVRKGEQYEDDVTVLGVAAILIAIIFVVCCTFIIPYFIPLFFGEDYSRAGDVIKIHSWVGVFVALTEANKYWLVLNNLQHYSLIATTIGAFCNVVLNIILISLFGINGAAFATLISQIIASYVVYLFFKDKRSLKIRTKCLVGIFEPKIYGNIINMIKK